MKFIILTVNDAFDSEGGFTTANGTETVTADHFCGGDTWEAAIADFNNATESDFGAVFELPSENPDSNLLFDVEKNEFVGYIG